MEIKSVSDFIDIIGKIKTKDETQLFFRGHSDEKYELLPSLYRKENFHLSECKIYKDTIVNCPHEFSNCKNTLETLVKMQHYDIPTRLLDVTKNALVALYFACALEKSMSKNGEVIVLQIPQKYICYYDSDKITILANLAKQNNDFHFEYDKKELKTKRYDDVITKINEKYFGYLLHSIKEDKPQFFDIINPSHIEKVYAVSVKLDNHRIVRQNGAFLIFGVKGKKGICAEVNEYWVLKKNEDRIIIPSGEKENILKELKIMGITKSTLFPELDKVAGYLKEEYDKTK